MTFLTILFWFCVAVVFYIFFGYGIIVWIAVKIKEMRHPDTSADPAAKEPDEKDLPEVTLLIAAYNEEDVIASKMQNCLSLRYPEDKLHLMWITDGSTDHSPELLRSYRRNVVLHNDERRGKSAALDRAMEHVHTPLVVMTDANTFLNEDCIMHIVRKFDDPHVGCVAGEKKVMDTGENAAATEGLYWKYESFLKDLDDRLNSAMGAAGELIALRRELYRPIPPDCLGDDMFLSMGVLRQGYKIAYCKEAYAMETPSANIEEERKRKVRLGALAWQNVATLYDLMNPFKYGVTAFQFVSHRVMRWVLAPSCIILAGVSNFAMVLMGAPVFYIVCLVLQLLFYLAAFMGKILDRKGKAGILRVPYFFLFSNFSTFAGIPYLIKHKGNAAWEKAKRA